MNAEFFTIIQILIIFLSFRINYSQIMDLIYITQNNDYTSIDVNIQILYNIYYNSWTIYGLLINKPLLWMTNISGSAISIYLLILYIIKSSNIPFYSKKKSKSFLVLFLFLYNIGHFKLFFYYVSLNVNGTIAILFSLISNIYQLSQLYCAKNDIINEFVDVWVTLEAILLSICWIFVSLLGEIDFFILVPNSINVVVSVVLLFKLTYDYCSKKLNKKNYIELNDENKQSEVETV